MNINLEVNSQLLFSLGLIDKFDFSFNLLENPYYEEVLINENNKKIL